MFLNPTFLGILALYVLSLASKDQPSAAGKEELRLGIRNAVSCYSWAVSRSKQIMLNSILLSQLRVNICKPFQAGNIGGGKKTIIIVPIIILNIFTFKAAFKIPTSGTKRKEVSTGTMRLLSNKRTIMNHPHQYQAERGAF